MTAFQFVVRRLSWLARIPGVPHFFDSILLLWSAVAHPARLKAIEALEAAALRLPGVGLKVHRFGGTAFAVGGREIAHVHGNGLLDVHTGRDVARMLVAQGKARPHHVFGDSAWVSYRLASPKDLPGALEILALARQRVL